MLKVYEPAVLESDLAKVREIMLVVMTGVFAFIISLFFGRGARALGLMLMFVPSLFVALPRCWVLLSLRAHTRTFGALTGAGIVEALCLFSSGGISPLPLVVPVVSALCADILWIRLSRKKGRTTAAISGGVLAATRVGCAILLWNILWTHPSMALVPSGKVLVLIVCGNFVLGALAGAVVAGTLRKFPKPGSIR